MWRRRDAGVAALPLVLPRGKAARERVWSGDTRSGSLFPRLPLTPEHDEGSDRGGHRGRRRRRRVLPGSTAVLPDRQLPYAVVIVRLPRRLFMAD